jgi:hypothetical protein
MLFAKIEDGAVTEVATAQQLFPTTSFPEEGPNQEFLDEVGAMKVDNNLTVTNQQKLVTVPAYIDGTVVRTVQVEAKTPEELAAETAARTKKVISGFQTEAGRRLDVFAQERGYGSIISVCTYDSSSVPRYAADALVARTLRDQWWTALNIIMANVIAGNRPVPSSFEDFEAELPELKWE